MAEAETWLASYAQEDITPALPCADIYLVGYDARPAEGIRDPLEVHALAREHHGVGVVLVALDLLGVFHEDAAAIGSRANAHLGDAAPAVIVCCSHTHAAPDLLGLWGPRPGVSGIHPSYRERVVQAAARAAVAASRTAASAVRVAKTAVEGVAEKIAGTLGVLGPLLMLPP